MLQTFRVQYVRATGLWAVVEFRSGKLWSEVGHFETKRQAQVCRAIWMMGRVS